MDLNICEDYNKLEKCSSYKTMVFCFKNCSDLLWEKNYSIIIIIQIWKKNWYLDPGISWLKYWGDSSRTEAKTDPSKDNLQLTIQQWLSRKSAVINGMCLSF